MELLIIVKGINKLNDIIHSSCLIIERRNQLKIIRNLKPYPNITFI